MFEAFLASVQVGGPYGALRLRATYQPTAGDGAKIAPPTYPDVGYLTEERYLGGEKRSVVAVDSAQSQANRLEEALVDAVDEGVVALPHLVTQGEIVGHRFRITSLDAPHRSPDAYFRDSETEDGTAFDESDVGRALRAADERSARALYRYSPADLAFGAWDSQRGGRGLRLPRAFTSEMIGLDPEFGKRGAVRYDPYNIKTTQIFRDKDNPATWALDKSDLPEGVKPATGKPSELNHGNVPAVDGPDEWSGGASVTSVERLAVLSFKVLRRLRFPDGDVTDPAVDAAGRAAVAALVLLADRLAFADASVFLRSGCDLTRTAESAEWVGGGGTVAVDLPDLAAAIALFEQAVEHAASLGLVFAEPVLLRPKQNLRDLLAVTFESTAEDS